MPQPPFRNLCLWTLWIQLVEEDREKWNRRYAGKAIELPEPDPFLVAHQEYLGSGRALDLACGTGGNAIFLAEHGYRVDAVDISWHALSQLHAIARARALRVRCILVDLDYFPVPAARYDLVVAFYFYDPRLLTSVREALKPGAILIYCTFNIRHTRINPRFNPAYLVQPEGLGAQFPDFEILFHETAAGDGEHISQLIARKPHAASPQP
ncbi:MAG: class I SAM-dependent methyltransferase [Desulfomonile tiedjei]|nr:class I SAM-dependent methyltransferase [Desulfomonile tiedjei]